jgi:GNAT superfamily N-acetyltransferase
MFSQEVIVNQYASPETTPIYSNNLRKNISRLTDKHIMSVQSWLSTRTPQAKRYDGLGLTATSSGLKVPLLNLTLGCNYPPGTTDEIIDHEIKLVKKFFANRKVPWAWWVSPHAHPIKIGHRLERHGLKPDERMLPALVASLPAQRRPLNPDIHVWQATCRADLAAASTIRRIAFNFPYATALNYFEAMADDWLHHPRARLFLARFDDGPPAAIGALIMGAGVPGVYVMATLPEWSRQGLGSAILVRILDEAAAVGYRLIALTASPYGYPLYRRFGFEHIFSYKVYRL